VRGYLDHLTVERGLAANTLTSYRRDLNRYVAALAAAGVDDLTAVTERHITSYLASLREGAADHPPLAAASAARAVTAVRGLHRFAHREGLAPADVAKEVSPPAPPRRLPKALEVAEVERLLAAAGVEGGARGLRDLALLEFLYGTGARISEATGASVDDVDLADGTALLRGKGGRTRLVPVGGYAVGALRSWLTSGRPELAAHGRGGHAIFLNARGGRLTRQGAWAILRDAAERAGLAVTGPHAVSPHTLRHSYATHLLDGGADIRVVQELLGHASVTTTQVYTLVTVDRLREVYATSHPRAR
jgi:integrase/recombinase XerD